MRKYLIVLILLIYGLYGGLISCNKTDSIENNLVGIWVSTNVDTIAQYVKPVKPETFRSSDYENRILTIHADGTFQMVDSKDTIIGTWDRSKSDSLIVTNNGISVKYYYDSKIDYVDKNNLEQSFSYSYRRVVFGDGYTIDETILYHIKVHWIRK